MPTLIHLLITLLLALCGNDSESLDWQWTNNPYAAYPVIEINNLEQSAHAGNMIVLDFVDADPLLCWQHTITPDNALFFERQLLCTDGYSTYNVEF